MIRIEMVVAYVNIPPSSLHGRKKNVVKAFNQYSGFVGLKHHAKE